MLEYVMVTSLWIQKSEELLRLVWEEKAILF